MLDIVKNRKKKLKLFFFFKSPLSNKAELWDPNYSEYLMVTLIFCEIL